MHEATIIASLMTILSEQAALHQVERIRRVTLRVGKLRAVEPQALVACFQAFAEGTAADGAELAVEEVPIRVRCEDCGEDSEIRRFHFRCAHCNGSRVTLTSGEELTIDSFET